MRVSRFRPGGPVVLILLANLVLSGCVVRRQAAMPRDGDSPYRAVEPASLANVIRPVQRVQSSEFKVQSRPSSFETTEPRNRGTAETLNPYLNPGTPEPPRFGEAFGSRVRTPPSGGFARVGKGSLGGSVEARDLWATARLLSGDERTAAAEFVSLYGEAAAYNRIGLAYAGEERWVEAQRSFERTLVLDPGNPVARASLMEVDPHVPPPTVVTIPPFRSRAVARTESSAAGPATESTAAGPAAGDEFKVSISEFRVLDLEVQTRAERPSARAEETAQAADRRNEDTETTPTPTASNSPILPSPARTLGEDDRAADADPTLLRRVGLRPVGPSGLVPAETRELSQSRHSGAEGLRNRERGTAEPRNLETAERRNPGVAAAEPAAVLPASPEPPNFGTAEPRSLETPAPETRNLELGPLNSPFRSARLPNFGWGWILLFLLVPFLNLCVRVSGDRPPNRSRRRLPSEMNLAEPKVPFPSRPGFRGSAFRGF